MALRPQVAEDVLLLLEKYPDLTATQTIVLKLAASLLAEDEMGWEEFESAADDRVKISGDDFDLIPGTIEVLDGLMTPKQWATPNRSS
jgi:hypothetical protein